MANLKLIKVTGSPFCSTLYGCIGIQVGSTKFNVIKGGELNHQVSSHGLGWEYATAEEIAENWKLIYPHWTPEPGDNVIVTQDYDDWTNKRGTIYDKGTSKDYWRVKRKDGQTQSFDYTCQMILTPTTSTTSTVTETKSESPIGWQWQDLKVGDKVKIIGGDSSYRPIGSIFTIDRMEPKDYKGNQPIFLIGIDGEEKGWPFIGTFEPYYGDVKKPKLESQHGFTLGDRVISIETSGPRANKAGTVVHFDGNSVGVAYDDYSRGHECNGHCPDGKGWYLLPQFIKHHTEPTKESKPEEKPMHKFKIGDRVQCINKSIPGYLKTGTVRETGEGNVGVEFDEYMSGHTLQGQCTDGYGWYIEPKDLDIVLSTKPKEETVIVRFLTEQEFKDKGLWNGTAPRGWNSRGDMNKYLGQSIVLPKSSIRSDGFFTYESWGFSKNDYFITEEVSIEPKSKPIEPISGEIYSPPKRFNIGDKVMYKVHSELPGSKYFFGGICQGGFVGEIRDYLEYYSDENCWKISVTTSKGYCYSMLEREFVQYDGKVVKPSEPIQPIQPSKPTKPEPKFYVGKPVTYKNFRDCGGSYYYSGEDKGGFVGTVTSYDHFVEEKNCYRINVTTPMGHTYMMLESEFEEYDSSYIGISGVTISSSSHQVLTDIRASVGGPSLTLDPLSSYKQAPITMKTKPKSKLRVI
jgi:hypothetical protein